MTIQDKVYNNKYYSVANKINKTRWNPGLDVFKTIAKKNEIILEVGCGEGTKLNMISSKDKSSYGIDLSPIAIKIAKRTYPHHNFQVGNIENLPFLDNYFDFVYSAYVFEHTIHPEQIINEMIRVTKKGGYIGIICPNFGSPIYKSPCSKENIFLRFLRILTRDFISLFRNNRLLHWDKVTPLATEKVYFPDWDTTIEPNLVSAILYFKDKKNISIVKKDSWWSCSTDPSPRDGKNKFLIRAIFRLIRIFGVIGIYPFKYYGPIFFLILKKR